MNNKNEAHHKSSLSNNNPISISTSTPISTISPTTVNATNNYHHHNTKQTNNTNPIQAALHAIERFNEQARQQQQQHHHHLVNPASASSSTTTTTTITTNTTLIDQKLSSRPSNPNLELGFRTMTVPPPGLPTPPNNQTTSQSSTITPITSSPLSISKPIGTLTSFETTTQPKPSNLNPSTSRTLSQPPPTEPKVNQVGIRERSGSDASSTTSLIENDQSVDPINESKPNKIRSSRGRRKSSKSNPLTDSPPLIQETMNLAESDRPNLNLVTDLQSGLKTIYSGKPDGFEPNRETQESQTSNQGVIKRSHHRRTSSINSTQEQLSSISHQSLPSGIKQSKVIQYDPKLDPGSPISVIYKKVESLPVIDQEPIKRTLDSISHTSISHESVMKTLPLRDSWRLFFSDTSPTSTTSSGNKTPSSSNRSSYLKASEYQSGMSIVFKEINTVESLCESLVGLKRFIGSKCRGYEWLEGPGKGIGLVAFKAQQNLHFFKTGVSPVWEDPWNNKGGRLTISLSLLTLDPIFESLILLIAGGVIETDTGNGGRIVGIVGSRRSRGDRIEIWLSGLKQNEPPNEVWIKKVIECLVREIGNEFKGVKFKRHL